MAKTTRRDFMKVAGAAALGLPGATFAQEEKKGSVPVKRAAAPNSLRQSAWFGDTGVNSAVAFRRRRVLVSAARFSGHSR
jgi:hypothetical protein